MRTEIRYPTTFMAKPLATEARKQVICSFLHVHDVPEVSAAETTAVPVTEKFELLEYEGRLFKPVGGVGEGITDYLLGPSVLNESGPDLLDPQSLRGLERRPLGLGLDAVLAHRLFVDYSGTPRDHLTWPRPKAGWGGFKAPRNGFRFEEIVDRLTEIDGGGFDDWRLRHAAQADKLVLVDGFYWIETRPPAYCVRPRLDGRVAIQIAVVPDWLDSDMGRQYFSLDAGEAAFDYAAALSRITDRDGYPPDPLLRYDVFDTEAFSFDHEAYAIGRTALLLGADVARFVSVNPARAEAVRPDALDAVSMANEMVRRCEPDPVSWADADEVVAGVVEAWLSCGRPKGWTSMPGDRLAFATLMKTRALDMWDRSTINLSPRLAEGPKP